MVFAIAQKADRFLTYVLSDSKTNAELEIVPERGGIVTQWRIGKDDILYLDKERFLDPQLSIRGGIPILFPICGDLPNNAYTYQGTSYSLPQHGFARNLPWQVTQQDTQNAAELTLTLQQTPETLAVYPFEFQIDFTYRLRGNQLEIIQRYTNRSDDLMPFSTGLHPYFNVPDKSKLQVEIPATQFQRKGEPSVHPFDGTFDFREPEIDVAFMDVSAPVAAVADPVQNYKLVLRYDPLYSTLVFWTVFGKDYYCLEPWSAPRNAINTGKHLTHLEPGVSLETSVSLHIEPLS
ncbi:MAG: aldose epimerase [Synechococcales cyanobacterium T60_A2020_003]|nr:aldose epimerase [Synechococcales cyanobacterium T60_A2020_003]